MTPPASGFPIDRGWAQRIRFVLFDFDGPVCLLFEGHDTVRIADDLRDLLRRHRVDVSRWENEPNAHHLLRALVAAEAAIPAEAWEWLTVRERDAATTARLTPGVRELLDELTLPLAVASNNAMEAIKDCLGREGLLERFSGGIHGRDPLEPHRMKPDPDCIDRALNRLGVSNREEAVLIGDSVDDALAAEAAGIWFLGFTTHGRAKAEQLAGLGAQGVVTEIDQLRGVFVDPRR